MDDYCCSSCGSPCGTVEETFDYSGTHCNHGIAGTHHTGHYVSDCCFAELTDSPSCPVCGSSAVIRNHKEPTAAYPEVDYWECEDCLHQWGHE